MAADTRQLADELEATELEMRVIYMVRSACGEREKRGAQGEAPFELMRRVELKHARKIIEAVRVLSAKVMVSEAWERNRLVVSHEDGHHDTVTNIEVDPAGDLVVWLEA